MTIGLIIAAAIVGWVLIKTILSFTVPEETSGRKYLQQQLRLRGVSTENIPAAFYADAIRWAQGVARVAERGNRGRLARKAEFVKALDTLAEMAVLWRREPNSPMFRSDPLSYRALFEKAGI